MTLPQPLTSPLYSSTPLSLSPSGPLSFCPSSPLHLTLYARPRPSPHLTPLTLSPYGSVQ